jgi:6-phosphogluconate dehydrogenase
MKRVGEADLAGDKTMKNIQPQQRFEIGMVGLGVMGRNLLLNMADHGFSVAGHDKDKSKVVANEEKLRHIVCTAAELGVPTPELMTAPGYLDGCRSPRLPMNLIQAQRDYFGAHTYERLDAKGAFHTEWENS